ncbi:MAG: hypothetical protein JWR40_2210 [Massilia sp.]|nr:hypothetical protein [Massilia sp.]
MQKLISELTRLYLPAGSVSPQALARHVLGETTLAIDLATGDGMVRAMVIPFRKVDAEPARHWTRLCAAANGLQLELGLPAPAVSISGSDGYGLWLSLEAPIPIAQAQEFIALLHQAYFPDMELRLDAAGAAVELPPCLSMATGKWAAFIHPGMGAAFADESGLEMAPPLAGQAAFLEGVKNAGEEMFRHAFAMLRESHALAPPSAAALPAAPVAGAPQVQRAAAADSLLLKDATLEDIVRFLHAKRIEPTFRHLID